MVYWSDFNYDMLPTTTASYRRDHKYAEIIASYDLESTNYHNIFAFMYVWSFGIYDYQTAERIETVYGRTWSEMREFLANIKAALHLNVNYKLIVFDHNLKYDFGFFCRETPVEGQLIAKSRHEVLLCTIFDCFEFHDSYNYTEKSLDAMGEEIGISKLKGYDYTKIRHAKTALDQSELAYISRDPEILLYYFAREARKYGGVGRIPLTATQRVKRLIYDKMAATDSKSKLMMAMVRKRQLNPDDPQDRTMLKLLRIAFFGGFNYCTTMHKNELLHDCDDFDADSHYIAQILLHKFPKDRFAPMPVPRDKAGLQDLIKHQGIYKDQAMLITFTAKGVRAKLDDVAFLPMYTKNYINIDLIDRRSMVTKKIHDMDRIETTLTDVDFYMMFKYYDVEQIQIKAIFGTPYGVLPDYIIDTCVELYQKKRSAKAELKQIKEQREPTAEEQAAYDLIKSFLNRVYGIFVQDPVRTNYYYDGTSVRIDKFNRINTKKTQFAPVLYQWGVWVASWARYELLSLFWMLAFETRKDGSKKYTHNILYCDTDSIKGQNIDINIISQYNEKVKNRVRAFCERKCIDFKTLDGLGEFKREHYDHFKTIGQKQYAYITPKGDFVYHISGLSRPKRGEDGLEHCYFDKFATLYEKIEALDQDMHVPGSESGLMESIYGGERPPEVVEDYNGDKIEIHVRCYVLLQPKDYKASDDLDELLAAAAEDPERTEMMREKFFVSAGGVEYGY